MAILRRKENWYAQTIIKNQSNSNLICTNYLQTDKRSIKDISMHQHIPGAYSEPYQASMIEPFVKTVTGASR